MASITRLSFLIALALLVLAAPAGAQAPHVVATANGATATSSANEGEIQSCDASGCTFAITAPARPPSTWNGELPVNSGTVIELSFARPVELLGASVVTRSFNAVGSAAVEPVDDQHWRVVVGAAQFPDRFALELRERWTGEEGGRRHTVHRTDYVGLTLPAAVVNARQSKRGGGPTADVEVRAPAAAGGELSLGSKTLGQRIWRFPAPQRVALSVPLSQGARKLLAARRRLVATLTLTFRPASGESVTLVRRVTLRAKPR